MHVQRSRLFAAPLVALAAALLAPRGLWADDPLLGEAWEAPILQGLQEQEQARKGGQSVDALLQGAKAKAARRGDPATTIARKVLLARAYGLAKDQASARQVYAEVLREAPRCYFAWLHLAMLDLERLPQDRASAEANLRRALAIHPMHLTSARKLSRLLLEAGRDTEAVPLLRRIVDGEPLDVEARKYLIQAYGRLKQFPQARAELDTLRRRDPRNPEFRALEAELAFLQGDLPRAKDLYRALAQEYPSWGMPFGGWLRCLDAQAKAGGGAALAEEYERVVEGLLRLEKDPQRRKALQSALDQIRAVAARKDRPAGPPTDAEVLQILKDPRPEARTSAIQYVLGQATPPNAEVLRAVLQRLAPETEPVPAVRVWALRGVGRFGGYGLAGLVRHSLADPDPGVRTTAVATLSLLSSQHPSAAACALLVLAPLVTSGDANLSAAARLTAVALAHADVAESSPATEIQKRDAFLAWWNGPSGREAKIEALVRFRDLKDRRPEGVLLPYLRDPDFQVVAAAYRALTAEAASGAGTPRAAWWAQFPRFPEDQVVEARRGTLVARVESWAATRP